MDQHLDSAEDVVELSDFSGSDKANNVIGPSKEAEIEEAITVHDQQPDSPSEESPSAASGGIQKRLAVRVCSTGPDMDGRHVLKFYLESPGSSSSEDCALCSVEPEFYSDAQLEHDMIVLRLWKIAKQQEILNHHELFMGDVKTMDEELQKLKNTLNDHPVEKNLVQLVTDYLQIRAMLGNSILEAKVDLEIDLEYAYKDAKSQFKLQEDLLTKSTFTQSYFTDYGLLKLEVKKIEKNLALIKDSRISKEQWEKDKINAIDKLLADRAYYKLHVFLKKWLDAVRKDVAKMNRQLETLQKKVNEKKAAVEDLKRRCVVLQNEDVPDFNYHNQEGSNSVKFPDENPPSIWQQCFVWLSSFCCHLPLNSDVSLNTEHRLSMREQYYCILAQLRLDQEHERVRREYHWLDIVRSLRNMQAGLQQADSDDDSDEEEEDPAPQEIAPHTVSVVELPNYSRLYKTDCCSSLLKKFNSAEGAEDGGK